MIALNLEAKGIEQEKIKAYLEENADEELADKINEGVYVDKDGKELLNKKTLDGFMKYAVDEARKQAEKGANGACIEDKIVYGWAMHYFEEDDIIGTLYNEDGEVYKPVIKQPTPTVKPTVPSTPPKPKNTQTSFFDMLNANTDENNGNSSISTAQPQISTETEKPAEKPVTPDISPVQPQKQPSPLYQSYLNLQAKYNCCILWIRLGDFYEALGECAKVAANELDLTLTGRDYGLDERVPICGIPYHAADAYFENLINKGYKVAVAEDSKGESVSVLNKNTVTDELGQKVDIETGEIINDEPEDLPTVSKITEGLIDDDTEDDEVNLEYERELAKAFNKEALCILSDLFDGELTIM